MKIESVKEYRLLLGAGAVQLHHIVCSQKSTFVDVWTKNPPGGISVETILELIERHHDELHQTQEMKDELTAHPRTRE